jgi:hypothetical protein
MDARNMELAHLRHLTPYAEVNAILAEMAEGISGILGPRLIGLYLFGSLSYADFLPERSDIDLMALMQTPATANELELLQELHRAIAERFPAWVARVESSYTPIAMLVNTLPPGEPRPYFGGGNFYPEAAYGNEWIINLYLLRRYGIALLGPAASEIIPPVSITDVQKACIRDLFREWKPKTADLDWLDNSHYQSYLVLNLCRILHTVLNGEAASKTVSATWVGTRFPEWSSLIADAENWTYGQEMKHRSETIRWIEFSLERVTATDLYQQVQRDSGADSNQW